MKNSPSVGFFALVLALSGCQSSPTTDTGSDANAPGEHNNAEDQGKNDAGGQFGNIGANVDTGSNGFDSCAETTAAAAQQNATSNLIIAVDTSGSMSKETEMVQENINTRFAQKFGSKPEVDVHIVLISEKLNDPNSGGDGMCVSSPLGSGICPDDTNPAKLFWHIHERVGSHNSLEKFIDCYDGGPAGIRCGEDGHWKDFISPGGFVHFVVVSDDDSLLDADEFEAFAKAEFGSDYMVHGIVSDTAGSGDNISRECDKYAANEGAVYKELITRTGGVFGDLCLQDNNEFDAVFDQITTEVVTHVAMPCEWTIPSPPDGSELDPAKVNVEFTDGATLEKIGKVDSAAECDDVVHGWYYNDKVPPTQILTCSRTCDWIQGKPDAKMHIKFGCKTIIAQPK